MTQTPFTKSLQLHTTIDDQDYVHIQSPTHSAKQLNQLLCYRYPKNFFGTTAQERESLILPLYQLLDVLSETYRNPFLQIDTTLNTLLPLWESNELFDYATFDGQLNFTCEHGTLLRSAVLSALHEQGIAEAQLETLLPTLKNGGWPLQAHRKIDDVYVAVRLSEPVTDDNWLLETVLYTDTTAYWTPAQRKKTSAIEEALPQKWKALAPNIQQEQARLIDLLSLSQHSEQFLSHAMSEGDVRAFLRDDVSLLQAFGFEVILPSWLKSLQPTKMRVALQAGSAKAITSLDDLVNFNWEVSLGEHTLDAKQFMQLVESERELVRIGTDWFKVDAKWTTQIKAIIDKATKEKVTVRDLLLTDVMEEITPELEDDIDPLLTFQLQKTMQQFVATLRDKEQIPTLAVPPLLQATLRPYQKQGFEWLTFMRQQNLGACLADDMGLGKTVQLITYLTALYDEQPSAAPSLIICPTSVLGNWQKELARFAPHLNVYTHYTAQRAKEDTFNPHLCQVVLTTYGTITQDIHFLAQTTFAAVVLDEAQNIKNMQTMQSKAIRQLQGTHHIALTGTPVENRLAELWAIFDFIQKGYLGTFSSFVKNYITPIEREQDENITEKLRMKIQPFLLRRTKRDENLALNLPDKQEVKDYCPLTAEQAALYEAYVSETALSLQDLHGIEKKGKILVMLNKLKQLCNHPALYLKEPLDDAYTLSTRSFKVERILQLTSEIVSNGEQCLIFTQYVGMGKLLQYCLNELYEIEAPFLTGSTTKSQRDALVDGFQSGEFPVLLLSLKAGGTGLNLTAATHVLHADRWWNPAVENQATDRAYRIGQTKFVQVHKFITLGTLEEKIDQLLTDKLALSEELIQSSKWLTELSEEELQQLMTLER